MELLGIVLNVFYGGTLYTAPFNQHPEKKAPKDNNFFENSKEPVKQCINIFKSV